MRTHQRRRILTINAGSSSIRFGVYEANTALRRHLHGKLDLSTGGIGEHAAVVRARICQGLGFLGVTLHGARNAAHRPMISTATSRVKVRVIATDEETMIARAVLRTIRPGSTGRRLS